MSTTHNNRELNQGFQYAEESNRIQLIDKGIVLFHGHKAIHILRRIYGIWQCNCGAYQRKIKNNEPNIYCAHTIAVEIADGPPPQSSNSNHQAPMWLSASN